MSKSSKVKQSKREARTKKNAAMSAVGYESTGKSKYARKSSTRNSNPNSPFYAGGKEQ